MKTTRTRRFRVELLAVCLAFCQPVAAAPPSPSPIALEVFTLSGLERQLAAVQGQVVEGITSQGANLSEERRNVLLRVARNEYAAETLRADTLSRLDSEIAEAKVAKAIAWLRSPLGRRITALEERASTAEALAEMRTFAQSLTDKPASPERVKLVQRLEAATGATDAVVNVTLGTTLGIVTALNAASDAPQPMNAIRERVESQRDQMRTAFSQVVTITFLYTYQELSDRELAQCAEFYESESGRSYNQIVTRAFSGAMTSAAMRVGTALADDLRKMPPPQRAL